MFDTKMFGVGVMNKDGFESIGDDRLHFSYSWRYEERPVDDIEAKEMSDELKNKIRKLTRTYGRLCWQWQKELDQKN